MSNAQLETAIESAWDARDTITSATKGETRDAIEDTLNALDSGTLRVAEKMENGDWHVNQWQKRPFFSGSVSKTWNCTTAAHKALAGGTKSTASSKAGVRPSGKPRASALFPTALSANPPTSPPALFLCPLS